MAEIANLRLIGIRDSWSTVFDRLSYASVSSPERKAGSS